MGDPARAEAPGRLRPWHRLSVRHAVFFGLVTVLAVAAVGWITYDRYRREVEDTVGTQLLNIARVAALLVDPALHAEVVREGTADSAAYRRVRTALAAVQGEVLLSSPIATIGEVDAGRRLARSYVVSAGDARPGAPHPLAPELIEPLRWTFEDGVARYTGIYRREGRSFITAFSPIAGPDGSPAAVVTVDYPIEIYLDRLRELERSLGSAALLGGLGTLLLGFVAARRLTRPISALTAAVGRVAGGDLSQPLPVGSRDEVGQLTRAFNAMLDGLRQRDFIRSAFGRYVSPEVARALLDAPEGLRFGGATRTVTVLMSDLRGYTQFAERGGPAEVMDVLNRYLGRMTDVVVAHGGTINEFIGDAVFAVFGAPLEHPDHAERAVAAALAMQRAMAEVNAELEAAGAPRFEMGIGVNTGPAVVGNIGSEQRAKYAVVGSAVNVAARVESATVGGQVYVTAATWERVRELADAEGPVPLSAKGLAEPIPLYEVRAIGGPFAQTLPTPEAEPEAPVALPAECWLVEGKRVAGESRPGTVRALRGRELHVELDPAPAPLTNLKLRVQALGRWSGDLYGKVVGGGEARDRLARVRLTAVAPADERLLAEAAGLAQRSR